MALLQRFLMILLAFLWAGLAQASQPTIPSNLQIVGTITGAGSLQPATNDIVRVVRVANLNQVEGQGTVLANDGTFFIDISKPSNSFNGTNLTLQLRKGNAFYQLNSAGSRYEFPYNGTFPFPSRLSTALEIGPLVSGSTGTGGSGGGSAGGATDGIKNDQYDVDGSGAFNQGDIRTVQGYLGKASFPTKVDVNNDGVINTLDIIVMRRALIDGTRLTAPRTSTQTLRQGTADTTTSGQ